eukprot:evm.model.scf_1648.1 EVM.evm.TU.scf_1648.1   scf_1648:269-8225(+)
MGVGMQLVACHSSALDVKKFYSVEEVGQCVRVICDALVAFSNDCGIQSLDIAGRVPQEDVCQDKKFLEQCLGYILGKKGCSSDGIPLTIAEELQHSRSEHKKRLKQFVVPDDHISLGNAISASVHGAKWRRRSVAVKLWAKDKGGCLLDSVTFARLYSKATYVNSACIVTPYAMTWSGLVLMELGEGDMMAWYKRNKWGGLKLKLQLLWLAAVALEEAHSMDFVHREIRAKKFIVFKNDPLELKIRSFDLEAAEGFMGDLAATVGGKLAWVAPEILKGKPHSFPSDIYSFGIMMYELLSEAQPYGDVTSEEMKDKKMNGQPPCTLPGIPKELVELMLECCSLNPGDRPKSMEDVEERLEDLYDSYEPSAKCNELPDAKYNKKIMGFLDQQLAKFMDLSIPPLATQGAVNMLREAVETGQRLLDKHRAHVDIQKFYQSFEARELVEHLVCEPLWDFAVQWLPGVDLEVERRVPEAAFDMDRKELAKLLGFVLQEKCASTWEDPEIPQEWHDCRAEHLDRIKDLPEADDEDFVDSAFVGQGGFSVVHAGNWKGQQVAVKKCRHIPGMLAIECRAELLKDALIQKQLSEEHVPKLFAISKSGMLLMELAHSDLKSFCRMHRLKSPVQLRLLLQAAERLRHLHSRDPPMVHCDVKSSNFLVFGNDPSTCTVKIADFGLTSEVTATKCNIGRKPRGTPLWVAPELYEGEVLSLASDVYSFGIVLYEVTTGTLPFVSFRGSEQGIMKRKLIGDDPWGDVSNCEPDLQKLVRECCHRTPQKRPTTAYVCRRLSELEQRLEDPSMGRWATELPKPKELSRKIPNLAGLQNGLKSMFTSMEEENPLSVSTPVLQDVSTGDADQGIDAMSPKEKGDQDMPEEPKLYFRYNRNCMEFLQRQMTEAMVLKIDYRPEVEANAVSYIKACDHALNLGRTLIFRHAKAFDMQKFYTAAEAREGAQAICKILKACVEWWNVEGVEIVDRVPQEAVEEDEKTLDTYLGYILGMEGGDFIFNGLPADIQEEWKQAKQEHEVQLRSLQIVPDEDIGPPQQHISGSVYVATYRGREHAVKSGNRMDNVGFARFYTEAAVMELVRSPSVVRLFAVTRSGKLVMEKGEMDIMTWFWQHRPGGLKLKLRLLCDAAQSLNDVHYAGLVHRDIRTKKFVVFGGGQPEVKLVGFGKASTGNITGKNTVRKHGKNTFAAPEIFEEKPCDMKSDIYSFGIVMYEMIGETLPYGRGATDAKVMLMKRNGEPPFDIPTASCPAQLLTLMAECCAVDPADRPSSMEEVQQRLTKLVNLDDPQVCYRRSLAPYSAISWIGTFSTN